MANNRLIDGEKVPFTAEEEAQLVKDKASYQAVQDALKAECKIKKLVIKLMEIQNY